MRPQIVIAALVFLAVSLAGVFYFKLHLAPAPLAAPEVAVVATVSEVGALKPAPLPVAAQPVAPAPAPVVESPEQRQVLIDAEIERLQQWSTSGDPADVPKILADLSSPEKTIREAAIQAAKQVGGADAVAALKDAAANTTDAKEQLELQEAADFIALPDLSSTLPTTPRTPEQIQASRQKMAEFKAQRQAIILERNHIDPNNLPVAPAPDANAAPPQNN
jgi:hypothetical protein